MVEFALVAPLFFALFIGLADFGRGFLAFTEISMGSRAAARQAVLQYNAGSNTVAGCAAPCQAPGVVPIIQKQAGFGFPIVYQDSTSPTIASPLVQTPSGSAPYNLSLASTTANNTIYVIVYEYNPATSAVRWPIAGSARDPGHQFVVVDLKFKWTPMVAQMLGLNVSLPPFDSQTIQRIEY